MSEFHADKRPTLKLNEIRKGYIIIVTGHADCDLYAHTKEYYDCGCVVTFERDCYGAITIHRCDECDKHLYGPPRIIIYNPK